MSTGFSSVLSPKSATGDFVKTSSRKAVDKMVTVLGPDIRIHPLSGFTTPLSLRIHSPPPSEFTPPSGFTHHQDSPNLRVHPAPSGFTPPPQDSPHPQDCACCTNTKSEIPQKQNAYDCGVHICLYARSLLWKQMTSHNPERDVAQR